MRTATASSPSPAPWRGLAARAAGRLSAAPVRIAAALAVVALLLAAGAIRRDAGALRGDEATFAAMAASLARDGDLRFEAADESWARARPERPAALILQLVDGEVSYSKPVLYPLLATPFVLVVGDAGFLVVNLLVTALAAALAIAALRRRAGGERAGEVVAIFVVASPAFVYLAWRMTEALQVALAAAGLALALGARLGPAPERAGRLGRLLDARGAPWAGMALLGLLVALREPNAAVAAIPPLAALLTGPAPAGARLRRALGLGAAAALAYAAVALVTLALTGAPNPYKSLRSTFSGETGYPLPGATETIARFDSEFTATSMIGAVPRWAPDRSLYAAFYFVVGRHSGLLAYFPAALVLLAAALGGSDRIGRAALAGAAASALFYLVWWPSNYFGGETMVGNRYFLAAYPALVLAPRRLPGSRALAAGWLLALLAAGSALASVSRLERAGEPVSGSQSHSHAGLFRALPYESVASNIEGRRDRYWSRDFVRFVDPFARVERTSFELRAGEPAAELEIAAAWAGDPVRFLVTSSAPRVELVVSDWLRRERFRLSGGADASGKAGGVAGPIAFRPAPAWRRHRFWWESPVPYRVRTVRLRLVTPDGSPATARLRYLGREPIPESGFEREVIVARLPPGGEAAGAAAARVALVHRGGFRWSADGALPVRLGLRLVSEAGGEPIEHRTSLPRDVAPGERLDATLEFTWPAEPGRYRATLDLVLEDVAWFADRVGAPLAERVVTVRPEGSPPPE